jgi:1-acyl-sn-glycerol-3-phosphate acyltransferase
MSPRSKGVIKGGIDDVRLVSRGWRWGRRSQVPRSAEEFVPPAKSTVFPSDWSRRRPAMAAREVAQKAALQPLFRSQVRTQVEGLDVLQRVEGPVIFVANHASHLDTPLILLSLPDEWRRRTAVAAAADYFFDTWWRATGSAMVFNTFPIERRSGSLSSTPGELLDDGWHIVVFPEGTRSPDGWTHRFHHGAAFLALRHHVPVVPIGIRGSFAAMPRGRSWPVPGRPAVTVRFGEPLRPVPGEGPRELGGRIESSVARLIDEDATTWWEATRRAAAGRTPSSAGPDVARWRRVWAQTAPPAVRSPRRVWR